MTLPPSTALPWRRRHPWLADLLTTLTIGLLIGLMLFLVRGKGLWVGLAYSCGISLSIGVSIGLLQRGMSRWLLRSDPDNTSLQAGWPGWAWMMPCVLVGALLGNELGTLLVATLLGHVPRLLLTGGLAPALYGAVFVVAISLLVVVFFYSRERLNRLELERSAVLRQAAEAQLTALQAQLEPHMLFNTLAHLRALIGLRPHEAQAMLDELIAYLRATLQASRTQAHPLQTEFARLSDYLKLMQRRMGPRLQVELDLPAELAEVAVPPLLLQPLVENAIQHGLEPAMAGGRLSVRARRDGSELVLEVEDTGLGLGAVPSTGTGFGTQQVRERLHTQYGDRARMDLEALQPGTRATVRMPA